MTIDEPRIEKEPRLNACHMQFQSDLRNIPVRIPCSEGFSGNVPACVAGLYIENVFDLLK